MPDPPVYANVIPCLRLPRSIGSFTYRVPDALRTDVREGSLVRVPFRRTTVQGYVNAIVRRPPRGVRIEPMTQLLLPHVVLPDAQRRALEMISTRYLTSPATSALLFIPHVPVRPRALPRRPTSRVSFRVTREATTTAASLARTLSRSRERTRHYIEVTDRTIPLLLYGYLARILSRTGRTLLLVCAERQRAETIATLLERSFRRRVALVHGGLPPTHTSSVWASVADGTVHIVVTTRSGLFVPFPRLDLIVLDQCEHDAHKQWDQQPRVHNADVVDALARASGASVFHIGTTPRLALERQLRTRSVRRVRLHRVSPLHADLIDMRTVRRTGWHGPVAERVFTEIRTHRNSGRSTILLLNRRGRVRRAWCPACETSTAVLLDSAMPTQCPTCGSHRLVARSIGVEQVAADLAHVFPGTQWADAAHPLSFADLSPGSLVVATEWVLTQPFVTSLGVAGIIEADLMLARGDYRARERALILVRQFLSWAHATFSFVQTYAPEDPVFRALSSGSYRTLYDAELRDRRSFSYPPFGTIIALHLQHRTPANAATIDEVKRLLVPILPNGCAIDIVPTTGSSADRAQTLLVRLPGTSYTSTLAKRLTKQVPAHWSVDIDPLDW